MAGKSRHSRSRRRRHRRLYREKQVVIQTRDEQRTNGRRRTRGTAFIHTTYDHESRERKGLDGSYSQ